MATALVTGASRGIGNILARALAAAGWRVVVTARDTAKVEDLAAELNAGRPRTALAVGMDVAIPDSVEIGVTAALDFAGDDDPLELLVNNAGTIEDAPASPWDVDPEEWSRVIQTNLVGPFNLIRRIAPGMIERGGGRIVDLNSGGGATGMDDYSAYGASKAGLFRLAQAVRTYGAEHGIRIFEMAPGVVQTEMTAAMPMHAGRTEWTTPEQLAGMIVAIAAGELDDFSGRYIRVGADSPESLKKEAAAGLSGDARLLRVH
ncbi:SDR family NAD(P)-dependent oxidoreductase [Spelaeicoccus albus]|uniref:NAD(P)-dependent dehydrogenase (Short-subunit alcohol dehydrogenase family) n=1 Tax=Spelaeicoccus albus TaxID=1280376 RepID=A0A7Z0IHQ3_9MICO|nr:SDR family oxidoreductase [Spelaeicoccus albus]NYI67849.1 NAD(P)-dependent dehydrogenase (short-subunit alcohol dehydrogenase family) [Spelaeicoccus albus]